MYQKSFVPSWSIDITMTLWQIILELIKPGADRPKILLAKPEERCQSLCKELWRLFDIETGQIQALWQPRIYANTYSLLKKPFNRLCDWFPNLNQLEKQNL